MTQIIENMSRLALLTIVYFTVAVVAAPYQELEPRAGHVPVYIRVGETPLSEINPKLAEAFNEVEKNNLITKNKETDVNTSKQSESLETSKPETEGKEIKTPIVSNTETPQSEAKNEANKDKTADNEEVPALVVEDVKKDKNKETDIASFDVIKSANEDNKEQQTKSDELESTSTTTSAAQIEIEAKKDEKTAAAAAATAV